MEGIFFLLTGAALFSHSWYILGLYTDGRTMGVVVGGLGAATLIALVVEPQLLIAAGKGTKIIDSEDVLAQSNMLKSLIIVWAAYGLVVAAQGLWDFDERAIGFYGIVLLAATAVPMIYFFVELQTRYGDGVMLGVSIATLLLAIQAGMLLFYLAVPFLVLRLVAGWFLLIGGGSVAALGMLMLTTVIRVTG